MHKVRKNTLSADKIDNPRLKKIVMSPALRYKLEALILLDCEDVCELFNITNEELELYKKHFFDIDPLKEQGLPYVLDYLEDTGQTQTLTYMENGVEYTKARLGLSRTISPQGEQHLFKQLMQGTLIQSLGEEDLMKRLSAIKTIQPLVAKEENKETSVFDQIENMYKEAGEDI